ncbi:MAG: class I SAM-dependent methyltransferase [Flavobacteriales bacterium]
MTEFWESAYKSNSKMWGEQSTDNVKHVLQLFQSRHIKNVLIPGFGYGRNAKVFYDNGINVSGIELSKTAIERARLHFGNEVIIHHGSVESMPFDKTCYEAIYCYSLIHLLDKTARIKLIEDCYAQLALNGLMIFVALSSNDKRFGQGKEVNQNTFQSPNGLNLFFYDEETVKEEFEDYNIIQLKEIDEPEAHPNERHWMIVCEKIA